MRIFAVWIKRPNDVAVQCSQHSDARVHDEVAAFSGTDQTTNRGLPFLELLLSLRQARDVVAGIAQSHKLAPTRERDGIIEGASPDYGGLRSDD